MVTFVFAWASVVLTSPLAFLPHLASALKLAKVANRPELRNALSLGQEPQCVTLPVWENQAQKDRATRESSAVSYLLHVGCCAEMVAPYG